MKLTATNKAELLEALETVRDAIDTDFSIHLADAYDAVPRTVYRFPWYDIRLQMQYHKRDIDEKNLRIEDVNAGKHPSRRRKLLPALTIEQLDQHLKDMRAKRIGRIINQVKRNPQYIFSK